MLVFKTHQTNDARALKVSRRLLKCTLAVLVNCMACASAKVHRTAEISMDLPALSEIGSCSSAMRCSGCHRFGPAVSGELRQLASLKVHALQVMSKWPP